MIELNARRTCPKLRPAVSGHPKAKLNVPGAQKRRINVATALVSTPFASPQDCPETNTPAAPMAASNQCNVVIHSDLPALSLRIRRLPAASLPLCKCVSATVPIRGRGSSMLSGG